MNEATPATVAAAPRRQWRARARQYAGEARALVADLFLTPTSGEAISVFRIALGILVLYYLLVSVSWNIDRYYGERGILPRADWLTTDASRWTLLGTSSSELLLHGLWAASIVAAAMFTLGLFTRVAAVLTYAGLVSFYNRNPWLMNAGDHLVVILVFLCIVAPAGLRFSVDAWLRRRRAARTGRLPAAVPVYGVTIVRLLVCFVYLSSFVHKMSNSSWRKGEAVTRILDSARFGSGLVDFDSFPIVERMATWGTLVIEGVFLLALLKRWRPWILIAGIGLHLGIELMMKIPMFTAVMLVSYIALLDDGEVRWLLRPVLGRWVEPPPVAVPVPALAAPAAVAPADLLATNVPATDAPATSAPTADAPPAQTGT